MRPKTTGRFDTRSELLERVRFLWQDTSCNQATIARNCHVSAMTISKIINDREWEKRDDARWLDYGDYQMAMERLPDDRPPIEPVEALSIYDLQSCGEGWTPEPCFVHLPDRIKRELDLI